MFKKKHRVVIFVILHNHGGDQMFDNKIMFFRNHFGKQMFKIQTSRLSYIFRFYYHVLFILEIGRCVLLYFGS